MNRVTLVLAGSGAVAELSIHQGNCNRLSAAALMLRAGIAAGTRSYGPDLIESQRVKSTGRHFE